MKNAQSPRPTRRAVARGALWTMPVVAVTGVAPAYAYSCAIVPYTAPLNTAKYGKTSTTTGSGSTNAQASSAPVTYTVTAAASSGATLASNNIRAAGDTTGGYNGLGDLASDGLQLQQQGALGGQTITIAFSRPVWNLSFTVADIDSNGTAQYVDQVFFDQAPTSVANASAVTGSGTAAAPLKPISNNNQVNSDVVANRSKVTFSGPISSLSMTFSSASGTVAQQIFLTGMTFSARADLNC